jgi:hypothetical protein
MPPTATGVVGQRVFGGEERIQDPADGLYRVLQQLLKTKAPAKAEVLAYCEGIDATIIDTLANKTKNNYANNSFTHIRIWDNVRKQLADIRAELNLS